jgi:hypothetical protein
MYSGDDASASIDDNLRETQGEAEAVPQQHKSAFMAFLSQLASFSGDLRCYIVFCVWRSCLAQSPRQRLC